MTNPYEQLVKEYLELCEGYDVKLDTKVKECKEKGCGWGDIGIIAIHMHIL